MSTAIRNTILLGFLYFACVGLTAAYVNLYPLYDHLTRALGRGPVAVAPYLPPAVLLFGLSALLTTSHCPIKWRWFTAGTAICIGALFIPDPEISVKRIHVTEYLLLSLLARYTMSLRLQGRPLLLFATLFTAILGIHDELLQGIHPARTYGLRDMLVNTTAATGGGCIWHGLSGTAPPRRRAEPGSTGVPLTGKIGVTGFLYLGWLIVAIVAMIVPLTAFRHTSMPLWPCLPLAAAAVFRLCLPNHEDAAIRHGIAVLSAAAFPLLLYPIVIHGWRLPFF